MSGWHDRTYSENEQYERWVHQQLYGHDIEPRCEIPIDGAKKRAAMASAKRLISDWFTVPMEWASIRWIARQEALAIAEARMDAETDATEIARYHNGDDPDFHKEAAE